MHINKCLLLLSVLFSTITSANISDEKLNSLIELSGIQGLINDPRPGMIEAFNYSIQSLGNADKVKVDAIRQHIQTIFTPEAIFSAIKKNLQTELSPENADVLIDFYQSTLGMTFKSADQAISDANFQEKLIAYAKKIDHAPPEANRINTIQQIIQKSHVIEMSVETMSSVQAALVQTLSKTEKEADNNIDLIKQQTAASMPQIKAAINQELLITFLYLYQDISDEALSQYLAFISKDASQQFTTKVNKAMIKAYTSVSRELGQQVRPLL